MNLNILFCFKIDPKLLLVKGRFVNSMKHINNGQIQQVRVFRNTPLVILFPSTAPLATSFRNCRIALYEITDRTRTLLFENWFGHYKKKEGVWEKRSLGLRDYSIDGRGRSTATRAARAAYMRMMREEIFLQNTQTPSLSLFIITIFIFFYLIFFLDIFFQS